MLNCRFPKASRTNVGVMADIRSEFVVEVNGREEESGAINGKWAYLSGT